MFRRRTGHESILLRETDESTTVSFVPGWLVFSGYVLSKSAGLSRGFSAAEISKVVTGLFGACGNRARLAPGPLSDPHEWRR
jgi:hypothetical protein